MFRLWRVISNGGDQAGSRGRWGSLPGLGVLGLYLLLLRRSWQRSSAQGAGGYCAAADRICILRFHLVEPEWTGEDGGWYLVCGWPRISGLRNKGISPQAEDDRFRRVGVALDWISWN